MLSRSEVVKRWRRRTKERIVEAMGSKCVCCGYARYQRALALHHLDPEEKELSFNKIIANPKKWARIVEELRKCVLVCHNCHSEIHGGIREIPQNAARFDESYVTYKPVSYNNCPVCGHEKPIINITCSKKCAGTLKGKLDWDKIDLAKMLDNSSMRAVAKMLNVSYRAVFKRAKKLKLR